MPTEDNNKSIAAEFLLEEYRELSKFLIFNEERGEKRLEFFVTLSTVVLGAIGLVMAEFDKIKDEFGVLIYLVIIFLLCGLVVTGIIIRNRLKKRNDTTDGLKKDIRRIRNIYKELIDTNNEILPADYHIFEKPDELKQKKRGFTSLYHIATVINCVMIGTATAFVLDSLGLPDDILAALSVIAVVASWFAFKYSDTRKGVQGDCTHAGSLVYKLEGGNKLYLVVTSSKNVAEWVLPKGHIEKGEALTYAATRELLEEAGVVGAVERPLAKQSYTRNGKPLIIQYYLMRCVAELHNSQEGRAHQWLPKHEALKTLSFDDAKNVLAEA